MQIDKNYIIKIYRELHQVPEIGFDLPKTLAIVRRELDAIEIPYTEKYGRSCIIATLNEGVGSKAIALRADMDALPMPEETGLPYASTHPGKMHACGHDAHTAMLLGTAKALKAMQKDIKCCVKFIFQSAEEILGGAKTICDDGFMDQVDEIIGCHISTVTTAGYTRLNRGCCYACSRGVKLHLYGRSAHVTSPGKAIDAIEMAFRVYNAIKDLRDNKIDPAERVILTPGTIHGGTVNNTICDHVVMEYSLRTMSTERNTELYERIGQIAESIATEMGGSAELETYKYVPALINTPEICDAITTAVTKVIGEDKLIEKKDSLGGEDFAYYALYKPAAMFDLGVKVTDVPHFPAHNGKMRVNEDVLDITPRIFIQYILDRMEK